MSFKRKKENCKMRKEKKLDVHTLFERKEGKKY
jgi:hypothetical protein